MGACWSCCGGKGNAPGFCCELCSDMAMCCKGASYVPTKPHSAERILNQAIFPQLRESLSTGATWTFVDLGCGEGVFLPVCEAAAVSSADLASDTPVEVVLSGTGETKLFSKVMGVELDVDAAAVAGEKYPQVEVIAADMFQFVRDLAKPGAADMGHTMFYMYEPLWLALLYKTMTLEQIREMYDEMLGIIAALPSQCMITYMSGCWKAVPQIPAELFEKHGFERTHSSSIMNSAWLGLCSAHENPVSCWISKQKTSAAPNASKDAASTGDRSCGSLGCSAGGASPVEVNTTVPAA